MLSAPFYSPTCARTPSLPDNLCLRTHWPSLVDVRFSGDAWIIPLTEERLSLCLGTTCLANIHGLPLDLPSLNRLLERARRHRRRSLARRGSSN